jgi:hypothetical protein
MYYSGTPTGGATGGGGGGASTGTGGTGGATSSGGTSSPGAGSSGVAGISRLVITLPASRLPATGDSPVTASAFDTAGKAISPATDQIRWTTSNANVARVSTDASGSEHIYAGLPGDATLTATDSVSGTRASAAVHVGYPLRLTLDAPGASVPIRFSVGPAADGMAAFDRLTLQFHGAFERIAGAGQKASVSFTTPFNGATVLESGQPVSLSAPATWGDLRFNGWTLNGKPFGGGVADVTLDPKTLSLDGSPTFALAAGYVTRATTAGGYDPNYLDGTDPNSGSPNHLFVFSDVPHVRVTFITADDFTADKKLQAEAGFLWWTQVTAGKVQFDFLPDGDTADANVIVCFTSNGNDAAVHPGNWIPHLFGRTITPLPGGGRTFYDSYVPTEDARVVLGAGKRVIHVYSDPQETPDDVTVIAAHEMFHALGLSGHSDDEGDVMFPYELAWRYASGRDVNTLLTLLQRVDGRLGRSRLTPTGPPRPAEPIQ